MPMTSIKIFKLKNYLLMNQSVQYMDGESHETTHFSVVDKTGQYLWHINF